MNDNLYVLSTMQILNICKFIQFSINYIDTTLFLPHYDNYVWN